MVIHACNHEADFENIREDINHLEDAMGVQRAFDVELAQEVSEIKGGQSVLLKLVFVIIALLTGSVGILLKLAL